MSIHEIVSEIAGSVWKIQVNAGDQVESGDELMILESMKMEIPVLADEAGVVEQVLVEQGASVEEGQPIITLRT